MTVVAQRLENLKASNPPIDLSIFQSLIAENFAFRVQLVDHPRVWIGLELH